MSEKEKIKGNCPQINIYANMTDYKLYVPFVLGWEGGVSNHVADTGGLTNKGITYGTYKSLCKQVYGCEPSSNHFYGLDSDSVGLMIRYFWNKSTGNNRIGSQKIAEAITSWAWGSGTYYGLKWFQEMLNKEYNAGLQVDAQIGILTVNFINGLDQDDLFRMCIKYRRDRFIAICKNNKSQYEFLVGWLNRLREFAERHGELEYFNSINV